MKILKRNGREVNFNPSKILQRIKNQSKGLKVNADELSISIISQMMDGITSRELDNLCIEGAAMKVVSHPDYSTLASRLFVTGLRKDTPESFSQSVDILKTTTKQLGEEFISYVDTNKTTLDAIIVHDRDFNHDIFGLKTLEKSYLLRDEDAKVIERPQYMWLRTAIEVSGFTLDFGKLAKTYNALSKGYYTHATPTLYNSGTKLSQLSSCFLLATKGDDLDGLFDTLKDCARISKLAGGIGLHTHNVRAKGSLIEGTNGKADGLLPMYKTFNETARWINQGGKRKGSFAMYLEPWHKDIFDFLEMKKPHGKEEMRARDLFYALWMNDLFMERVTTGGDWTLFCPNEILRHNGVILQELVCEDFKTAYLNLEQSGIGTIVKASELWEKILVSQMETGTPYIVYKDKANVASNQKNLGTIKSSNLCFTGDTLVAVADGRNAVTIKELSEKSEGRKTFPVYSARNKKDGKRGWKAEIKTAVAFSNGYKKVIELTLSNGDTFKCTPDHRIALRDGGYAEAKDMIGKDVSPFFSFTSVNNESPYRHINSISNGHSKQHLMMWDYYNPNDIRQDGYHIDHIESDVDSYDNIVNLQKLTKFEHRIKTGGEVSGKNNMVHKLRSVETYKHNLSSSMLGNGNSNFGGVDNYKLIEIGRRMFKEIGDINVTIYNKYSKDNDLGLPKSFSNYRFGGKWSTYFSYCRDEKTYNGEFDKVKAKIIYKDNNADRKKYINDIVKNLSVVSIIESGEEEVFDLTVEDNNNFFIITSSDDEKFSNSNGLLVHNCAEIIEYSSEDEQAVCNLASIALNKFVDPTVKFGYDFEKLGQIVELAIENLDNVIDANYYPTVETEKSNSKHRPVGLGVQGLADTYALMKLPFASQGAAKINKMIFEQMYYSATKKSMELSIEKGAYSTFKGSPASKGILQFDMYNSKTEFSLLNLDWKALKQDVIDNGLRNSLLIALMPTASTSQILGNNECFEPFTSNMYTRRTLAGEYIVINKHLVRDLEAIDLWVPEIVQALKANNGSIQDIDGVPGHIKDLYKTAFEVSQKVLINQASDRQRFICQSQSMNLFVSDPNLGKLSSMHAYGWRKELKTGIYYLRGKSAVNAKKFTVEAKAEKVEVKVISKEEQEYKEMLEAARDSNEDDCTMCGA